MLRFVLVYFFPEHLLIIKTFVIKFLFLPHFLLYLSLCNEIFIAASSLLMDVRKWGLQASNLACYWRWQQWPCVVHTMSEVAAVASPPIWTKSSAAASRTAPMCIPRSSPPLHNLLMGKIQPVTPHPASYQWGCGTDNPTIYRCFWISSQWCFLRSEQEIIQSWPGINYSSFLTFCSQDLFTLKKK